LLFNIKPSLTKEVKKYLGSLSAIKHVVRQFGPAAVALMECAEDKGQKAAKRMNLLRKISTLH